MQSLAISRKTLIALSILCVAALIVIALIVFKPEAKKRKSSGDSRINVEVRKVERKGFKPQILSYGLVEPRIKSSVVAQVTGRIDAISERFRDGGFFKKDDLLLQIDMTDYEIELEVAKANLADAERALQEEKAQAQQASEDWYRRSNAGKPTALVLREPQLKAAKARVKSQLALLKRAQVNLTRTSIKAPFDGRVLSTNVDLGQVASNNAVLGEIYATDAVEVRLPIKNDDIEFLNLPEVYGHTEIPANHLPAVDIISELSSQEVWQGYIVRTSSAIDSASRQLYVVARIEDPFGEKAKNRFPLKIGQYVSAHIQGVEIEDAITIPNQSIYQGAYVYTVIDGAVYRKSIEIQWQNGEVAMIKTGLSDGDKLVTSPLGQVSSGTPVKITNEAINGEIKSEPKAAGLKLRDEHKLNKGFAK